MDEIPFCADGWGALSSLTRPHMARSTLWGPFGPKPKKYGLLKKAFTQIPLCYYPENCNRTAPRLQ